MPGIGIGIGIGMGMGVGRPQASLFNRIRAELFGSGEQGIYMPSVHESFLRGDLYQDSEGATPVTAAGQSVGLWLDWSKGGPGNVHTWESPSLTDFVFDRCTAEIEGDSIKITNDGSGYGAVRLDLSTPSGGAVRLTFAGRRTTRARLYGDSWPGRSRWIG